MCSLGLLLNKHMLFNTDVFGVATVKAEEINIQIREVFLLMSLRNENPRFSGLPKVTMIYC